MKPNLTGSAASPTGRPPTRKFPSARCSTGGATPLPPCTVCPSASSPTTPSSSSTVCCGTTRFKSSPPSSAATAKAAGRSAVRCPRRPSSSRRCSTMGSTAWNPTRYYTSAMKPATSSRPTRWGSSRVPATVAARSRNCSTQLPPPSAFRHRWTSW